jgi:YVTN family beta-propeller protein
MTPSYRGSRASPCPGIALALALVGLSAPACKRSPHSTTRVYVSNEDGDSISVIDGQTEAVVATIPVGKRPRGMRLSPDGHTLYVALSGSPKGGPGVDESKLPPPDRSADGIGVVDLASQKLVRVLPSGADPESFDVTPDGRTLYVSNEDTAQTSVVDLATGVVRKTIDVGREPEGVAVRPDGRFVYVTSEASNEVDVIDTSRGEVVTRIATKARPRGAVFSRDGKRAYVTTEAGATVHVVDATSHTLLSDIHVPQKGARPMGLVLSPDETRAYVTNGRGGSISVVDVFTGAVERDMEGIAPRPWGIGASRDGKTLYVAGGPSNDLVIVDAPTGIVRKKVPVGSSPWGVVVAEQPSP